MRKLLTTILATAALCTGAQVRHIPIGDKELALPWWVTIPNATSLNNWQAWQTVNSNFDALASIYQPIGTGKVPFTWSGQNGQVGSLDDYGNFFVNGSLNGDALTTKSIARIGGNLYLSGVLVGKQVISQAPDGTTASALWQDTFGNTVASVSPSGDLTLKKGAHAGYFLQSDANGLASWQPVPAGGIQPNSDATLNSLTVEHVALPGGGGDAINLNTADINRPTLVNDWDCSGTFRAYGIETLDGREIQANGAILGAEGSSEIGADYFVDSGLGGRLDFTGPTAGMIGDWSCPGTFSAGGIVSSFGASLSGQVTINGYYPLLNDGSTVINAAQIPSLNASKITTGTFGTGLIPSLDASKISTGTFNASQIPGIAANKITAATFPSGSWAFASGSKVTFGGSPGGAACQYVLADDTNPGYITSWDTRHCVWGNSSGGLGVSYQSSSGTVWSYYLTPNIAWRTAGYVANRYDFILAGQPNGSSILTMMETGSGTGSQCRLGIGNYSPSTSYLVDIGGKVHSSDNFKTDGQFQSAVTTLSSTATLGSNNQQVELCNAATAAFSVNLPSVSGNIGMIFTFKKIDSSANVITITPNGTQKIEGQANYTLSAQYSTVTIVSDGANWFITAKF